MNHSINRSAFFILALFILSIGNRTDAQDIPFFKSDVETYKKPWTNLDFYNNPDNFQFVIMGDRAGGIRQGIFEDAILKINEIYPEFVLSVGDIIEGYTRDPLVIEEQRKEIDSIIGQLKMPFFRLPGNHDITNPVMEADWEQRYGKRYYSFTYKNTLFVILDSNDDDDYSLKPAQTEFVLKTLKENPDVRWTFVLMHHPIWNYNTNGRFQQIEAAMAGRNFTVIAGHTHRYYYEEKNDMKYYVIATTGGSSELAGNRFGRFDHIVWMTMTDQGPSFVNLRLDGILPGNVSNAKTAPMARALLSNTNFNSMLLCGEGDKFENGTLYIKVSNSSDEKLYLDARFFHHHQLKISKPVINMIIPPGTEDLIEITLEAINPLAYSELEPLEMDWLLRYDLPEYPDFKLDGVNNFILEPSSTSSLKPEILQFLENKEVMLTQDFNNNLTARFTTDGTIPTSNSSIFNKNLILDNTKTISLKYFNNKGQGSKPEIKTYEKVEMQNAIKVRRLKDGLQYSYYEGNWDRLPDFSKLKPVKEGLASDFEAVSKVNLREDNFAMVFKGYFYAPEDGMYVFRTIMDDAGKLFINNNLVVNEDLPKSSNQAFGTAALKKGYHPVEIQYLEQGGDQRIRILDRLEDKEEWKLLDLKGSFFY